MADWYVRLANGSDASDGTTYATAKLTLSAAVLASSNGDTIYVSETGIGGLTIDSLKTNLTIIQDPGRDQAIWIGATAISTWTDIGGSVYTKAIAAALGAGKVAAVLFNYLTQQNATGSHYGTLKRLASAAAVVAAASGTAGCFYYETTATGLITAYFGGADPNSGTTHYVYRDNVAAIKLTGNGNRVSGIWFKAWHNDAQGACVWLEGVTSSGVIENCKSWDCGPHAFIIYGGTTATANGRIVGCTSDGAKYDGAHFTHFQTEGSGNLTNCTFEYCRVERHNWFNIDQSDAGPSSCAQIGWYTHADTGAPILGSFVIGGTSNDQDPFVNAPIAAAGNTPAPSNVNDPTTFPAYASRCNFRNMTRWNSGNYAFDQCVLRFDKSGSSGLCHNDGLGTFGDNSASANVCVRACELYFDFSGDGTDTTAGIIMNGANQVYRFINTSICMVKPDDLGWSMMIQIVNATAIATFTGCIFSYTGDNDDNQQFLCYATAGSTANFVVLDCLWGLTEAYGGGPGFSFSAPGDEDPSAQTVATNPFTQYATDLRITASSSARGKKRTTFATVPSLLINGPYDRSHGAYSQVDTTDNAARGRGTTDPGRDFWRRR